MTEPDDCLNILVTYRWQRLSDSLIQRIRDVSPRLNVIYADTDAQDAELLPTTDILYTIILPPTLANAPRLKWIQLLSAGYNSLFGSEVERSDIPVTTSSGIHGLPISEFVLASMVMVSRRLPEAQRTTDLEHYWRAFSFMGTELYGATIGIVGVGSIGREIARLARAFGMRVIGVDPHYQEPWTVPANRYVPEALRESPLKNDPTVEIRPTDELPWLLKESDFVVLTLPVTPETHHLIGAEQLRLMKRSAFIVNPARGTLIDEVALTQALQDGVIAGAALDVFETEPLPAESPLYTLPNALVTPHMSAHTEKLFERCVDVFCANLRRYLAGEPLLNQVHPADKAAK